MVRLFIKEWRERKGISHNDVAERAGMSPATLSKIEAEQMRWTSEHLQQLALALDINEPRILLYPPRTEPGEK